VGDHGATSSDASKPPLTLDAVKAQLSSVHGIDVRVLPTGTDLAVSQSAAVTTALDRFGQSPASDASAFAVVATARHYGDVLLDGNLQLRISDRPVWLVLISSVDVPRSGPRGRPHHPPSYVPTLAVLVDANTGEYLMAATV
jgi:hypothetical protein